MREFDSQLLLLREIEARIAFAEFHVREQRETVQALNTRGLGTSLAHDLLRSMQDSIAILERRRQDLLATQHAGIVDPSSGH